jgi:hypothetical protein
MTASKTSRLGLMRPVGSDPFLTQDFADTFDILDARPGTVVVPNLAGRPTNWGPAQHGCKILQTDVGVEWFWNQPSSSTPGKWSRIASKGSLGSFQNSGSVSTIVTVSTQGPTVINTGNIVVPGGKPLGMFLSWDVLGNSYGKAVLTMWENNVRVWDKVWCGYLPPCASAGTFYWPRNPAPDSQQTVSYRVSISSYYSRPPNGGGATVAQNFLLNIYEF